MVFLREMRLDRRIQFSSAAGVCMVELGGKCCVVCDAAIAFVAAVQWRVVAIDPRWRAISEGLVANTLLCGARSAIAETKPPDWNKARAVSALADTKVWSFPRPRDATDEDVVAERHTNRFCSSFVRFHGLSMPKER